MKLEKQTFLLCYVSSHLTLDVDKIQWGFKVVNWSDYWTNGNDSFQLFNHSVLVYNKRHSLVDPPTEILSLGNLFGVSLSVPGLNILEHA